MKILTITFVAAVLAGCNDIKASVEAFTDKSTGYAQVETSLVGNGTHRLQVLALMGTPVQNTSQSFAGVDGESLAFTDANSTYRFLLVNNRTVSKSQSPKSTSTSSK